MEWAGRNATSQMEATYSNSSEDRQDTIHLHSLKHKSGGQPLTSSKGWHYCTREESCIETSRLPTSFSVGRLSKSVIWTLARSKSKNRAWLSHKQGRRTTLVPKYGEMSLTALRQMYGPTAVFYIRCAPSVLLLTAPTWRPYIRA